MEGRQITEKADLIDVALEVPQLLRLDHEATNRLLLELRQIGARQLRNHFRRFLIVICVSCILYFCICKRITKHRHIAIIDTR